jgi:undecaprenyl-diphosphatase
VLIILGTLPVIVAGLLLKDLIHSMFTKSIVVIVGSLVSLALLLWLAEKVASHRRKVEELTWVDALIVGSAQALALIPGSSRSGTTLTAGLFLGLERAGAARFSFLLSIPAVLLSGLYEMMTVDSDVLMFGVPNLIIGIAVSALSGYAAIAWLLKFLGSHTTMVFVWYRCGLGILLAVLLLAGVLRP